MAKQIFKYNLEKNDIISYMSLTPEQKLKWLEEILIFSREAMTPQAKKIRKMLAGNQDSDI